MRVCVCACVRACERACVELELERWRFALERRGTIEAQQKNTEYFRVNEQDDGVNTILKLYKGRIPEFGKL